MYLAVSSSSNTRIKAYKVFVWSAPDRDKEKEREKEQQIIFGVSVSRSCKYNV